MARKVNAEGLALLKRWEALVLYAYDDKDRSSPKKFIEPGMSVAGTLTIGWGHTRTVRPGMRITREKAEELFLADIAPVEAAVARIVKVPLTDGQFAALVSFAFNLGHATSPGTPLANIAEVLNRGDYAGAIARMGLYNKQRNRATGKLETVSGLVNRRAAEAGLWVRGDFVASAAVPAEAPPAPPAPVADAGKAGGIAAAAAAAAPFVTSLAGMPPAIAYALIGAVVFLAAIWLLRRQRAAEPPL
jgi:lysozyme